jgi:hypothetical protein
MHRAFRPALLASSALGLFLISNHAALAASDPLLDLLKTKGVISAGDAATIEGLPANQQRDRLVDLLKAKGILSAREASRLTPRHVAAVPTAHPAVASTAPAPRAVAAETPTDSTVVPFTELPNPPAALYASTDTNRTAAASPVQYAAPRRAPVAHTFTVADRGPEQGLYYATDRVNDTNPLSFKVGGVSFYPGGELRATMIMRSTNTGNVLGTNFGALPFKNTVAGYRNDMKLTAQGTLLDLRVVTDIGPVHVTGYTEFDFNGNSAANLFVNANSYTFRSRLLYMDAAWGAWELSAGQMYSWLTPNRVGLGPDPSTVFLTNNVDDNFNVGLTWTRATQVRVAYHPDDHWALGIAIENPDQYVGVGEVIFPFVFNAQLGTQYDAGNNAGAPAKFPDVTGKIAYDGSWGDGHSIHAEITGLITTEDQAVLAPTGSPTGHFQHQSAVGGGVGVGLNLELFPRFHAIANGFYSDGGGRYIGGLGPNVVVKPIDLGGGSFTADLSLVRSYSVLAGFEYLVCPDTIVSGYYGGAYFERNAFQDVTSPLVIKPFIGFGGPNSPNSANRYVWEATFDVVHTFWEDPTYGSVQLAGQFSYAERHPWFIALGAPGYAHLLMAYADVRFLFP